MIIYRPDPNLNELSYFTIVAILWSWCCFLVSSLEKKQNWAWGLAQKCENIRCSITICWMKDPERLGNLLKFAYSVQKVISRFRRIKHEILLIFFSSVLHNLFRLYLKKNLTCVERWMKGWFSRGILVDFLPSLYFKKGILSQKICNLKKLKLFQVAKVNWFYMFPPFARCWRFSSCTFAKGTVPSCVSEKLTHSFQPWPEVPE